jgi:ABC-type uncharacterized transport system ATPase subunit
MPFTVPLDAPVADLAAGEKQKLEILKLLYLEAQRFMILDEPTSVLTPGEADEMLTCSAKHGRMQGDHHLMITHKFREVNTFCDAVTVLRRGRSPARSRRASSTDMMAEMMVGRRRDAHRRGARGTRAGQGGARNSKG